MAEKLRLHSAEVTGKVQPIFIKVKIFGNFNLSQCLISFARLAGRSSFSTSLHFLFRNSRSKSMTSGLGKSSDYCSISPSISKSLSSRSQMIDGTSNRSLEAVLLNKLNPKVISAINWPTNGIAGVVLFWIFCRDIVAMDLSYSAPWNCWLYMKLFFQSLCLLLNFMKFLINYLSHMLHVLDTTLNFLVGFDDVERTPL